jgi:hypothetical protein
LRHGGGEAKALVVIGLQLVDESLSRLTAMVGSDVSDAWSLVAGHEDVDLGDRRLRGWLLSKGGGEENGCKEKKANDLVRPHEGEL